MKTWEDDSADAAKEKVITYLNKVDFTHFCGSSSRLSTLFAKYPATR